MNNVSGKPAANPFDRVGGLVRRTALRLRELAFVGRGCFVFAICFSAGYRHSYEAMGVPRPVEAYALPSVPSRPGDLGNRVQVVDQLYGRLALLVE